jgi:hypothetical protein
MELGILCKPKHIFEVNGNLTTIINNHNFYDQVFKTCDYCISIFGNQLMSTHRFFIDNGTQMCGRVPITIPVLSEYILIKLGVADFQNRAEIIFQLSHELCHCFFYAKLSLNKSIADEKEENYCAAFSLFVIQAQYPNSLDYYAKIVRENSNPVYRGGYMLFEKYRNDLSAFLVELEAYCKTFIA